ncbi:MAG: type II toxin-antitoxin system RelB/DinJ family antitoxin [Gordonibacter sp.]|uniref:type II toxin-antitoxin system RelB/DinJ family antitoxin n=1 Tax=Gordonibacter sp. TaxID=1968902 RepID=UPI002FCAF472
MGAVQMNTRLPEDLKIAGDEVLALYGLTPSDAVRELWGYLEKQHDLPAFMRKATNTEKEAERQRKLAIAEEGPHLVENIFEAHGITLPPPRPVVWQDLKEETYGDKPREQLSAYEVVEAYYDDLRDEAYDEKLQRGGL